MSPSSTCVSYDHSCRRIDREASLCAGGNWRCAPWNTYVLSHLLKLLAKAHCAGPLIDALTALRQSCDDIVELSKRQVRSGLRNCEGAGDKKKRGAIRVIHQGVRAMGGGPQRLRMEPRDIKWPSPELWFSEVRINGCSDFIASSSLSLLPSACTEL